MHITEKDVGRKVITRCGEEGVITYFESPSNATLVEVFFEDINIHRVYARNGLLVPNGGGHPKDLAGWADDEQNETTEDKEMKCEPFDLERALAGEPVVTRDGREVAYVMRTGFSRKYPIIAVVVDGKVYSYTEQGRYYINGLPSKCDLFMKPKTHIVNGFEVSEPVTTPDNMEIGDKYFCADSSQRSWFFRATWAGDETDMMWLERGLVFLTKEDAIANAKAMAGIDPYGD